MNVHRLILAGVATLCALAGGLAFISAPAFAGRIYFPGISFGEPGSGPGQLTEPAGVAVSDSTDLLTEPAAGNVYVVDKGNNRVERFSATGEYKGQFNGSDEYEVEDKKETDKAAPTGALSSPDQIAVDNSGDPLDPSAGDVYITDNGHKVIDKFSATGEYLSQITEGAYITISTAGIVCPSGGCEVRTFASLGGLAVDSVGDLWAENQVEEVSVSEGNKLYNTVWAEKFNNSGSFEEAAPEIVRQQFTRNGIAAESKGELYVIGFGTTVDKCTATGKCEEGIPEGSGATALAVVPSTSTLFAGDLLVDTGGAIEQYAPLTNHRQEPLEVFPGQEVPQSFSGFSRSDGVAVNASATVFASELGADEIQTFLSVSVPEVKTVAASGVSETAITLNGSVNPEGEAVKECYFEYGTATGVYANRVACEEEPGAGSGFVPVSAELSGLAPASVRSFRLVAVSERGIPKDGNDVTVSRPVVTGEASSNVGSASVTFSAGVDPEGLEGCYVVEYGTSTSYGDSTPKECIGSGEANVSVSVGGLLPITTYHLRVVATNDLGSTDGGDVVVSTFPSGEGGLPDGRAYELVSAVPGDGAGAEGDVYVPGSVLLAGLDKSEFTNPHGILSERPSRAAADGEAVAYIGDPPAKGGNGSAGPSSGNEFVATHSAGGGWSQAGVDAPGFGNEYVAFSSDLSVGVIKTDEQEAVDGAPSGYAELYSRSTEGGPFEPLFTEVPGGSSPAGFGYIDARGQFTNYELGFGGGNAGTSVVPAFSRLLFESGAVLSSTPEASGEGANNLYESFDGRLYLVNVLPDGDPERDATFGFDENTLETGTSGRDATNVISADGSRVYWSAAEWVSVPNESQERVKALYVRENATQPQSALEGEECAESAMACTVQVDLTEPGAGGRSGGGEFVAASSDGSRVFFTDEKQLTVGSTAGPGDPDLYEYDFERPEEERLSDLSVPAKPGAGVHGDVLGVIGVSETGSYAYIVAGGVLTSGANAEGRVPVEGQPNLYVSHEGTVKFVVTLAPGDGNYTPGGGGDPYVGDWQKDPVDRTAEVSPDGQGVVFMSRVPLTGYDNMLDGVALTEVFVYDSQSGRIACASCNPSGEAPAAPTDPEYAKNIAGLWGSFTPLSASGPDDEYQPRVISEDGSRVFFDSIEPLVPRDSNGYLDVYEWERDGSGSCREEQGCIYLLSGGQNPENSYLLDASANGNDVFFVSRAQMVKEDVGNDDEVLYDARVGGGAPPPEATCSGSGCQGVPPAPPIFATPASTTFNGVGNYPAGTAPGVVKKSTAKTSKCKKGFVKKKNKCVKNKKTKKVKKASRTLRMSRVGANGGAGR